jgi:Flp pilus assembly protein TadG
MNRLGEAALQTSERGRPWLRLARPLFLFARAPRGRAGLPGEHLIHLSRSRPIKPAGARFVREERGQEIVEFALASFVFLMTIFGTLEFGLAVWRYNMVSNLAQEGARWASVRGSTSLAPASAGDVLTYLNTRSTGLTINVTTTPDPSTLMPGETLSVQVQTTFAPLTQLIPLTTMTLQSTAKMVVAR